MKVTTVAAAAICLAGALASALAGAQALSTEAAKAMSGPVLYLPASLSDPGGVKGYDHGRQLDFAIEADDPGQFRVVQDKLKNTSPKKAVAGAKVKAGSYRLAPAPDASPN